MRGATASLKWEHANNEFQSTRPVRGATLFNPDHSIKDFISIHAPRAGRDKALVSRLTALVYFNPRAPCGARPAVVYATVTAAKFQSTRPMRGATAAIELGYNNVFISIHAPHAGRDDRVHGVTTGHSISIHAPHAGRDVIASRSRVVTVYFNPRAPCGARRRIRVRCLSDLHFNPRAPCGARRSPLRRPPPPPRFQSTRPMRGATPCRL